MSVASRKRRHDLPSSDSGQAKLFLAIACLWPLCLLALFGASAPRHEVEQSAVSQHKTVTAGRKIGFMFRDVLDRADIMGYGPTHPRVAVVIIGDDKANLVTTVESVFGNTDMNRIFVVVVVVDGHAEDPELVKELSKIDRGSVPHWHGLRPDVHDGQNDDQDPHGQKVQVLFNEERQGLAESRNDAVHFIQILEDHHETEGLKSDEEDLILLLLQSGAQLTSHSWLHPVTEALIVPPPVLGKDDAGVAMKLANAVAFNLEGPGKRTSFDSTFTPVISDALATDINLSNGESYPTPALNGAAVAMRLNTYTNLPLQDLSLQDDWPANLDLSLNLWLCADGIDILKDVEVTAFERSPPTPLEPEMAARFAAAWMDDVMQHKFFHTYTKTFNKDLTYLEWETHMAKARASPFFTPDLTQKCRSFQWFAQQINTDLNDVLEQEISETKESPAKVERKAEYAEDLRKEPRRTPDDGDNENDGPDLSIRIHEERPKPSKPLREVNLEIVQKAIPIDISYVDVANGHKDHPHMGARDADGNYGYIHDETALHEHPEPYNVAADELRNACLRRDNNYRMLKEKVYVDLEYEKSMEGKPRTKLFCFVYTTSLNHNRIPWIRETWGYVLRCRHLFSLTLDRPKCDGFMVASNQTDVSIGTVAIPHVGEEAYNNIWQKVRSMWSYVYDNYYEKYDWFHIGGDDLYLIVENLKQYLESEEIQTAANGGLYLPAGDEKMQTPLYLGRRFAYQGDLDDIFVSGGSGVTFNKAALKRLVVDCFPNLFPHLHTFSEDTLTARSLRKFGIYPYDTKDEAGGERYMPFMPGHHYGYRMPADLSEDWYAKYSIDIKQGADHCAAKSVAFHYVKDQAMTRLHALLYHLCPTGTQ